MFFKNLTLYHLAPIDFSDMEARLTDAKLTPVDKTQLRSRGFVSPFGAGNMCYVEEQGDYLWITLGGEDRILPPAVIAGELGKRIAAAEELQGRKLGGRARRRMKEELVAELLPRAFVRPMRLNAMIDKKLGIIAIDTSGRKAAEDFLFELRNAMGSFPVLPFNATASVRSILTGWLAGTKMPKFLSLGDEALLTDDETQIRASHAELQADEIQAHLEAGLHVKRLGLAYGDAMSFTLDEDLTVRKLKFLDGVVEQLGECDSLADELVARFALMAPQVRLLVQLLADTFDVENPYRVDGELA